jgi:ABC-2 type transport system ATP-binding protein
MLRVIAYKKIFGSAPVLTIPHLELEQNIYWLRGENGSGKTTFLKSVAGLIPFDGGIEMNEVSLKKRRTIYTASVNHAAAEPQYPSFLTGNDLIRFYLKVKQGNAATATNMASVFGMSHYLNNKVDSYSSGMTKKLSLVLAFTGQPKLILLDEPFSTLDIEAVNTLHALIKDSFANGISFCISSHQAINMQHASLLVQDKTIVRQ